MTCNILHKVVKSTVLPCEFSLDQVIALVNGTVRKYDGTAKCIHIASVGLFTGVYTLAAP